MWISTSLMDNLSYVDLELNSGERVRKPIDVQKPSVTGANVCASKVMSADELLDMDDIEFQLHDYDKSKFY